MNANVKYWLLTDEDRAHATYWDKKAMDYATKVLNPVISDIISSKLEIEFATPMLSSESQMNKSTLTELEKMCPNWGGHCKSLRFTNTCSIDNLIALISLNMVDIQNLIQRNLKILTKEDSEFFQLIESVDFNATKLWLAHKLKIAKLNDSFDFFGSEGPLLQFLEATTGSDKYKVSYQCWNCFAISERILNLLSVFKFVENCQRSIDSQITTPKCLKCRDFTAILENIDCQFVENPLLFFMEVSHLSLDAAAGINKSIFIRHKDIPLTFSLLGYTVHSADHFYLRFIKNNEWYFYDGIRRPKVSRLDYAPLASYEIISSIVYISK